MSLEIKVVKAKEQDYLGIREIVEVPIIPDKMGELFGELFGFMGRNGICPAGPPFAYYHSFSPDRIDMECGAPTAVATEGEGRIRSGKLPGGNTLSAIHIGPYDRLVETYNAMMAYAKEMDLEPKETMWECYLTDPNAEPDPSKWMTEIFIPLR